MERELTETKEQRAEALNSLSTLCDFFQNRVLKGPSDEALREFNRATKEWVSVTYKELGEKVKNWQRAFADLGLNRGDRVAMLLPNGVNAVCFDQAAMANSLVPVPLHAIDTPASSAFILQDCGASVLVTDKKSKWEKIQEAGFDLSAIKKVIITEELTEATGLTQGVKEWLMGAPKDILLPEQPKVDDLACIVYTSGTTGKPKGVMLTHKNITSNVRSTLAHVKPEIGDIFLSFLPLSHMFERTAGYYLALATGSTIVFNRSLQYLAEDFKIAKPNVLISVPRVYERIYAKLNDALAKKGKIQAALFHMAVNAGWQNFCRKNSIRAAGSQGSVFDGLVNATVGKQISEKLKSQFGGRLRVAISGGASLNPEAAKVFCGLGLPVIQGYWNREKDTKNAFTEDGWLKTGDQGAYDGEGRLKIVGRIKEILVTSTGEKISPVDIESALETIPLFRQTYAVGDGMPYIAVLISLDPTLWKKFAAEQGADPKDPESIHAPVVRKKVLEMVKKACRTFPAYAVPKNIALTLDEWTIDNGLLTPTLKLKRSPMQARYGHLIEEMYKGAKKSRI